MNRKRFLKLGAASGFASMLSHKALAQNVTKVTGPVVVSTWDAGLRANKGAWEILSKGGKSLDAVEKGVMVTEDEINCCVGLGANPDRDGIVTLDASIMDHRFHCGAVAALERIKHPIAVARRVMEKTPHVFLVGQGAQQFAVAEGFPLEKQELSSDAKKAYDDWLKNSKYDPAINRELKGHGPFAPSQINGDWNHDTIGMVAIDAAGHLAGSCTTSGMGFKMRGRLGDSPIIGAGLYVDGEVGACTATGQGEDVIRVAGSHSVVEYMRMGYGPEMACQKVIERIVKIKGEEVKKIQVAFLAINKNGVVGSCCIHKGFSYALKTNTTERLVEAKSWFQ
ncbi:MAG TPA: N(4)-(beta-N-acetylglucosaminyl)-L-asparaginase [Niabella sp.]|nr:N(4)-(beta-N-acetylglucosaminyl)-L-asparaginase [Niabella sp.]HOZ95722.1 N(4)-(beta-N-acetylglucosaminyl)-L-asparaginase [Niabella sp.]HQW15965.1 N(4)-(beta-N-acetylglucosaminyl)-L-asparaginase [Niabella sp.]HQX21182.1 N(4)-(beta-N-acetylglucosaminyl)-L-asparaginase [Niabella sp.]HQX40727.1 N(4)-(beta-N-acetylglucosaminyl)-L-asparaginase [Niabella sp.]